MFEWPGASPPQLFAWADGSPLSTAAYPELFTVLQYTYGGSGGTFNLPDCRGRLTVAAGAGTGLTSRTAGATGGAETVGLGPGNNGAHTHGGNVQTGLQNIDHAHNMSFNTGLRTADHTHTYSATTGTDSPDHGHQVALVQIAAGAGQWGVQNPPSATNDPTGGATARHSHTVSGTSAGSSADHQHPVVGATGAQNNAHQHNVTIATDGGGSAGTPHENMPPWIAIGKVIKVLSAQAAGSLS